MAEAALTLDEFNRMMGDQPAPAASSGGGELSLDEFNRMVGGQEQPAPPPPQGETFPQQELPSPDWLAPNVNPLDPTPAADPLETLRNLPPTQLLAPPQPDMNTPADQYPGGVLQKWGPTMLKTGLVVGAGLATGGVAIPAALAMAIDVYDQLSAQTELKQGENPHWDPMQTALNTAFAAAPMWGGANGIAKSVMLRSAQALGYSKGYAILNDAYKRGGLPSAETVWSISPADIFAVGLGVAGGFAEGYGQFRSLLNRTPAEPAGTPQPMKLSPDMVNTTWTNVAPEHDVMGAIMGGGGVPTTEPLGRIGGAYKKEPVTWRSVMTEEGMTTEPFTPGPYTQPQTAATASLPVKTITTTRYPSYGQEGRPTPQQAALQQRVNQERAAQAQAVNEANKKQEAFDNYKRLQAVNKTEAARAEAANKAQQEQQLKDEAATRATIEREQKAAAEARARELLRAKPGKARAPITTAPINPQTQFGRDVPLSPAEADIRARLQQQADQAAAAEARARGNVGNVVPLRQTVPDVTPRPATQPPAPAPIPEPTVPFTAPEAPVLPQRQTNLVRFYDSAVEQVLTQQYAGHINAVDRAIEATQTTNPVYLSPPSKKSSSQYGYFDPNQGTIHLVPANVEKAVQQLLKQKGVPTESTDIRDYATQKFYEQVIKHEATHLKQYQEGRFPLQQRVTRRNKVETEAYAAGSVEQWKKTVGDWIDQRISSTKLFGVSSMRDEPPTTQAATIGRSLASMDTAMTKVPMGEARQNAQMHMAQVEQDVQDHVNNTAKALNPENPMAIRKGFWSFINDWLNPDAAAVMKARGGAAKVMGEGMQKAEAEAQSNTGMFLSKWEAFKKQFKLTPDEMERVQDFTDGRAPEAAYDTPALFLKSYKEQEAAKAWRALLDEPGNKMEALGIGAKESEEGVKLVTLNKQTKDWHPFAKLKNYLPRFLQPDMKIIGSARRELVIKKMMQDYGLTRERAETMIGNVVGLEEGSPPTRSRFGSAEYGRIGYTLPKEAFVTDPDTIMRLYGTRVYRRIAQVENFGQNNEYWESLQSQIYAQDQDFAGLTHKWFDRWMGYEHVDSRVRKWTNIPRDIVSLLMLSPRSTVKHFAQALNPIGRTNLLAYGKGLTKLKLARDAVELEGLTSQQVAIDAWNEFQAEAPPKDPTFSGRIERGLRTARTWQTEAIGLGPLFRLNRMIGMSAGMQYTDQLASKLVRGGASARVYRKLEGLGVDAEQLMGARRVWDEMRLNRDSNPSFFAKPEQEARFTQARENYFKLLRQGGRQVVKDAVFQTGTLHTPMLFQEHPLLAQFQVMKWKQAVFTWNHVMKEAGRGNVMPLAVLATTGLLVGEIGAAGREAMLNRDPVTGQPLIGQPIDPKKAAERSRAGILTKYLSGKNVGPLDLVNNYAPIGLSVILDEVLQWQYRQQHSGIVEIPTFSLVGEVADSIQKVAGAATKEHVGPWRKNVFGEKEREFVPPGKRHEKAFEIAKEELVKNYIPFVSPIVRPYYNQALPKQRPSKFPY